MIFEGVVIVIIGLWVLVALGKLVQTLNAINRTLREINDALREPRA